MALSYATTRLVYVTEVYCGFFHTKSAVTQNYIKGYAPSRTEPFWIVQAKSHVGIPAVPCRYEAARFMFFAISVFYKQHQ